LQVTTNLDFSQIQFINNLSCLYSVYVRGQAHLAAKQGTAAAAEFQNILEHGGIVWNCWTGALAHLGLARAYKLSGDQGKARAAYDDFLALWKDADPKRSDSERSSVRIREAAIAYLSQQSKKPLAIQRLHS
jgi:hypothetical protein